MKLTSKIRTALKPGHVKKRYQAGRNKSLDRIGSFTRQSAQKQLLNKQPKKKPVWRPVGQKDGIPVLEVTFRPPTPGRVTSWKTGRGRAAKGFLRSSVRYERDDRRESVVIGPAENVVWLNKIQEFGGIRTVSWRYLNRKPASQLRNGLKVPNGLGANSAARGRNARGRFTHGLGGQALVVVRKDARTGKQSKAGEYKQTAGKVKPGRYMQKGLDKIRPKIPTQFKDFISGP
jgi:hypothetical protein